MTSSMVFWQSGMGTRGSASSKRKAMPPPPFPTNSFVMLVSLWMGKVVCSKEIGCHTCQSGTTAKENYVLRKFARRCPIPQPINLLRRGQMRAKRKQGSKKKKEKQPKAGAKRMRRTH